ncbi:hypothetical protein P9112_001729 [Eukaryota sp. TZLM1-RC]
MLRSLLFILLLTLSFALNQWHHDLYLDATQSFASRYFNAENWLLFEQRLDHFSGQEEATWMQRYCYNLAKGFKNGQPIFVYIGGESRMRDNTCDNGYIPELAKKLQGAVFALEHRFYGESYPLPDLTTESLEYLSSKQALFDLAYFTQNIKNKFPDSPVIIVGGSYPGNLAAWSRQMFPHLYAGAWSSSAPVLAKEDFYEYDMQVRNSLSLGCQINVGLATGKIEKLLDNPETARLIKRRFRAENISDNIEFLYVLADATAFAVQYNYITAMCNRLESAHDVVEGFQDFFEWLMDFLDTTPYEWTTSSHTDTKKDTHGNVRQWMYQSCNEFGYWQIANPENPMRSKQIDVGYHRRLCKKLFNKGHFIPDINGTNTYYGGLGYGGYNTAFANGSLDPWKHLGIRPERLTPQMENRHCGAVEIEKEAHCADLHASSSNDSEALKKGREFMVEHVMKFLDEFYNQ